MTAEVGSATYTDADLALYIERYPVLDRLGNDPYIVSLTTPLTLEANPDWAGDEFSYCLNSAASALWQEKAAALAAKFDFDADEQSFRRSQMHKHAMDQARYYAARRSPRTREMRPEPWTGPEVEREAIEE